MKSWKVDVTFEYQTRPPQTVKLTVQAGSIATASFRAVGRAKKQMKPRGVTSMVILAHEADSLSVPGTAA